MKHTHTLTATLAAAARDSTTGPHAPYMLIAYALAEKISSGELKPGDRMPSATDLVQTYDISPGTARRALAKLKEMSLTDTVPGYATFVRSQKCWTNSVTNSVQATRQADLDAGTIT